MPRRIVVFVPFPQDGALALTTRAHALLNNYGFKESVEFRIVYGSSPGQSLMGLDGGNGDKVYVIGDSPPPHHFLQAHAASGEFINASTVAERLVAAQLPGGVQVRCLFHRSGESTIAGRPAIAQQLLSALLNSQRGYAFNTTTVVGYLGTVEILASGKKTVTLAGGAAQPASNNRLVWGPAATAALVGPGKPMVPAVPMALDPPVIVLDPPTPRAPSPPAQNNPATPRAPSPPVFQHQFPIQPAPGVPVGVPAGAHRVDSRMARYARAAGNFTPSTPTPNGTYWVDAWGASYYQDNASQYWYRVPARDEARPQGRHIFGDQILAGVRLLNNEYVRSFQHNGVLFYLDGNGLCFFQDANHTWFREPLYDDTTVLDP
jgi:hypothetical protein